MAAIDKIARSELPKRADETGNSPVCPAEAVKLGEEELRQKPEGDSLPVVEDYPSQG